MLEIAANGEPRQVEAYRRSIEAVIRVIETTSTGKTVLTRVRNSARRVRITPFLRAQRARFGANALARPNNWQASGTFGAGDPAPGSSVEISYTPGVVSGHSPGQADDEVLLHEICHALRFVTGTARYARGAGNTTIRVPMRGGWTDVEEFFTGIVVSVHSSERGRRPRGGHNQSGLRNPDVLRNPPYSTRLGEIGRRMPDFVRAMAQINQQQAAFNPFRDYMPSP